jgi:hypothetical protein
VPAATALAFCDQQERVRLQAFDPERTYVRI